MYAILGYYASLNTATLTQLPAVPDTNFSIRNNNFIFTEPYELVAATACGATFAANQLFDATLNAINIPQVWPINGTVAIPSNPQLMDLRRGPVQIPMNEEIQWQASNSAGGAEPDLGIIWVRPSNNGGMQYPVVPGTLQNPRVMAVFTVTLVLTVGVWSPFVTLTFTNPLKGGAYQVNGLELICANGVAYKMNFVKSPLYQGRKMYPGNLTVAGYENAPLRFGPAWLDGLGRFNNFELPQISVLAGVTTGSTTYTGYADLTYLGNVGADAMP